jgi:hypothetical protein
VNGCNLHIQAHVNWRHAKGVGLNSGDTYQASLSDNSIVDVDIYDGAPATSTEISQVVVASQGSGDTHRAKVLIHFTTNANGDLTSARVDFTDESVS